MPRGPRFHDREAGERLRQNTCGSGRRCGRATSLLSRSRVALASLDQKQSKVSLEGHSMSAGRGNAQLFSEAAEATTRLFKSPDRNHFCLAANAVTALYREQEAEVARAQHRG